jgi:hypothetical protein
MQYRNARGFFGDPVPLLPLQIDPLFAYRDFCKLTHITAPPVGWVEGLDPVAWHSSELCARGIALYHLGL